MMVCYWELNTLKVLEQEQFKGAILTFVASINTLIGIFIAYVFKSSKNMNST